MPVSSSSSPSASFDSVPADADCEELIEVTCYQRIARVQELGQNFDYLEEIAAL